MAPNNSVAETVAALSRTLSGRGSKRRLVPSPSGSSSKKDDGLGPAAVTGAGDTPGSPPSSSGASSPHARAAARVGGSSHALSSCSSSSPPRARTGQRQQRVRAWLFEGVGGWGM